MAVIKHIAVKNSNYNAASDYLTTMHDEFECVSILDEYGGRIPRDDYIIEGILCDPFTFGIECEEANHRYGKNQTKNEIKAHHYIISFDPKDKTDNGLTMEKAQELGMDFAKRNFPGHQTLVCTHPDGHNGTGNIHIHIVINSLRIENVECPPFKERKSDCLAGMKHHVSKNFLDYLKRDVMQMCRRENLHQVDLLSPAKEKITDREYHAQRRGQAKLDAMNARQTTDIVRNGEENPVSDAANIVRPSEHKMPSGNDKSEAVPNTKYETQKGFLRRALRVSTENSHSIEELKSRLLSDYGIRLSESRGRFSFQIPERTKPIRARQLGTDFEKESITKYFEEKDGRAAMPVPDHAAHQGNRNTIESAVSLHGTDHENTALPDGAGLQTAGNPPAAPYKPVPTPKDITETINIKETVPSDHRTRSITIQKANTQENITIPKIQRSENQKSVGIRKISNPDHAMVQEKTESRDTKDLPNATTHTDHRTWDITGRPQPHVTPITPTKHDAKIPTTGKATMIQKTDASARQNESKKSSLKTGNQNQIHTVSPNRPEHSTAGRPDAPAPSVRLITDLESCVKAQQNQNYSQKVKISNLKEMSNTMNYLKENGIGSVEELDALVVASSDDMELRKTALKSTESRLKTVNLLIRYSGQYFANKKVYEEYLQAKNKKTFREEHRTEIALYESARKKLNQLSDGKPIPTMKQLKAEKETLLAKKEEQYASFSSARSRHFELLTVQQNVKTILHGERQHTRTREVPDGR